MCERLTHSLRRSPPRDASSSTRGFVRGASIPEPESILPYRHALIVNEYEIMDVVDGAYTEKAIRVAQWGIRNGRMLPGAARLAGAASTLVVERYEAHGELEGERVISASEASSLPLYL